VKKQNTNKGLKTSPGITQACLYQQKLNSTLYLTTVKYIIERLLEDKKGKGYQQLDSS
jgi:hypothetical protein